MISISPNDKRLMILYPTDIAVEQQLYKHKNLWINDVTSSMIELELSFKQIFFILLLGSKIAEAFKPVIQVVDHMGQ